MGKCAKMKRIWAKCHEVGETGSPVQSVLCVLEHIDIVSMCLCNPKDCRPPGCSVPGILQTRILPCPPPGDLPDPGMELWSPLSLALQEDSFPLSHQISPYIMIRILNRSFSKKKKKKDVKSLSRVRLCAAPWTIAYQAPPSMGFSRQEYWSGLPFLWSFSKWPINSVKQL